MDKSQRNIIILITALLILGFLIVVAMASILFFPLITDRITGEITTNDSQLSLTTQEPPTEVLATIEASATFTNEPTPTPEVETSDTPPSPTTLPTPTLQEIPADIASQMDQIEEEVISLHNLQPTGSVSRALLTREQLRQKVENDFFEDYSTDEARDDVLVLSAFGLLEPGFDMISFYQDLLSEQIAGQYDVQAKQMDVIQESGFGGTERLTYAHEYEHVLQDQNFDLENGLRYNDEDCENEEERCAAVQALVEGDASFSELEWFYNFATPEDINDIQDFYQDYESPIYDSAPEYLKEDFIFPYDFGLAFIQYLYSQGGWEAINTAFLNPPVSTEQILHPERYPADKPLEIDLPDMKGVLGEGWKEIDHGIMGEWYTFLILAYNTNPEARMDEATAQEASDGWGGDAYAVFYNEQTEEIVLVMLTSWESSEDANQFFKAFQDYSNSLYGSPSINQDNQISWAHDGGITTVHKLDQITVWIMTPDQDTAQSIWDIIQMDLGN